MRGCCISAQLLLHLAAMFTNRRSAGLLLFFAFTAAAQLPAQTWADVKALPSGTSVRISAGSKTVTGTLQGTTDDSLLLDSGKDQKSFPRQEVMRVSVKKQSHRGRNSLIGLGVGAASGAAIGAAAHKDCTGFCIFNESRGIDAGVGALVIGILGALAGALIPTGGWREVYHQ